MLHILLFLFVKVAKADSWLCDDVSSMRRGNTILACGIGQDEQENVARTKALDNAKIEFKNICDDSEDCSNHSVFIDPNRTECNYKDNIFTCKRLISFTINSTIKRVVNIVKNTITSIKKLSYKKVYIGMSAKKLVKAIGSPADVYNEYFYYRGDMCENERCTVVVDDGIVSSFDGIKTNLIKY